MTVPPPPPNVAGDNSSELPDDDEALKTLDASIAEARQRQQAASDANDESRVGRVAGSDLGIGFRIVSELVAGVAVGCILGYAIDQWLGSSPFGFIILFLLGSVAGMFNVIRYVNQRSESSAND